MTGAVSHRALRRMADLHAVYRMFDATGRLLYIGVTGNPSRRFKGHAEKRWYPLTSTITLQWFPTREAAERAEQRAIRSEHPKLNLQGMASPRPHAFTRDELVYVLASFSAGMLNAETTADAIIQALETLQEPSEPLPSEPLPITPLLQAETELGQPTALKLSVIADRIPGQTYEGLRRYSVRRSDFPEPVGRAGAANLYDPAEVLEWVKSRRQYRQERRAS